MTGRIGTLANLLPIIPNTAQVPDTAERYTVQEAAGRRWAFVNSLRPALRSWSVNTALLTPEEAGTLAELADGALGFDPLVYISCEAHANNVLTPAQSLLAGLANGGGVQSTTGFSPVSVVGGEKIVIADRVPVAPGEPCTVSVDASGETVLTVSFHTATGGNAGSKTARADGLLMQRVSVTVPQVPATARYARITASGYTTLTRPQLTWNPATTPWTAGLGASSVIIQKAAPQLIHGKYWGAKAQILEVG